MTDVLSMVKTHCPICLSGPTIDCSDMAKCPLSLAKYKGIFISPEEFARTYGIKLNPPTVVERQLPEINQAGQFSLF